MTITASNNSDQNVFVKEVTWNGNEVAGGVVRYSDLMGGGELAFTMVSTAPDADEQLV